MGWGVQVKGEKGRVSAMDGCSLSEPGMLLIIPAFLIPFYLSVLYDSSSSSSYLY